MVKVEPQIMEKKRTVHGGRTSGSPYGGKSKWTPTLYNIQRQTPNRVKDMNVKNRNVTLIGAAILNVFVINQWEELLKETVRQKVY